MKTNLKMLLGSLLLILFLGCKNNTDQQNQTTISSTEVNVSDEKQGQAFIEGMLQNQMFCK